jgi:hypothetical protein
MRKRSFLSGLKNRGVPYARRRYLIQHCNNTYEAVFHIRDISVQIRLYSSVTIKKLFFSHSFFASYRTFWRYIYIILRRKVTKQYKSRFFLLFLLDDGRIRIRICTSDKRIRIRKAENLWIRNTAMKMPKPFRKAGNQFYLLILVNFQAPGSGSPYPIRIWIRIQQSLINSDEDPQQ